MKREVIMRWLLLAAFAVTAISGFADIPRPSYHALSRSEWEVRQREVSMRKSPMKLSESQHKVVETIRKITCGHEVITMLVCHVLSLLGVTVCVAYVPLKNLVLILFKTVMLTFFLILLFASVGIAYLVIIDTGIAGIAVADSSMDNNIQHDDIMVDPKPGETYEEYERRVYEYNNRRYGNPRYRDEGVQRKVDEEEEKFTTGFTEATKEAVK